MKKIFSVLIMAIFIVSLIPISLAEEGNGNGKSNSEDTLQDTGTNQENTSDKVKGPKPRVLAKMQIEKARENFIKAKEKFEEMKLNLGQAKQKFQEQVALRKNCKNETECNMTEEQLKLRATGFLGNSADAIIAHLNKVKNKIEENEDLTEEQANGMIADIDAKIADIDAAKEQLKTATTKEEIREAAKKINAAWKNIKSTTRLYANELINARIGGIIVKSEHLKEKLDRVLTRMKENGKDTEDIQPLIDQFNAKIKLAKEKYDAAVLKFNEIRSAEEKSEVKIKEAKDLMHEAKKALKEANEKLREIIKAIKEENGEQEIQEENEGNQTEG